MVFIKSVYKNVIKIFDIGTPHRYATNSYHIKFYSSFADNIRLNTQRSTEVRYNLCSLFRLVVVYVFKYCTKRRSAKCTIQ